MIIPKNPYQDADRLKSAQESRAVLKHDSEKLHSAKDSEKSAPIRDKVELSPRSGEVEKAESGNEAKESEITEADRKTAGEGWYKHGYKQAMNAFEPNS